MCAFNLKRNKRIHDIDTFTTSRLTVTNHLNYPGWFSIWCGKK